MSTFFLKKKKLVKLVRKVIPQRENIDPNSVRGILNEVIEFEEDKATKRRLGLRHYREHQHFFYFRQKFRVMEIESYKKSTLFLCMTLNDEEMNDLCKYLPETVNVMKINHNGANANLNKLIMKRQSIRSLERNGNFDMKLFSYYKFKNIISFTSNFIADDQSSVSSRKERILFNSLNLLPNLRKVERNSRTRLDLKYFDQIKISLIFNNQRKRSNLFILNSMIYKNNVFFNCFLECQRYHIASKKYWLKEIKYNNCFIKYIPSEQDFRTDFFKMDEYF